MFSFLYDPRSAVPFLVITAGLIYSSAVFNWGPGITDDSINYLYASTTFPDNLMKADNTPFVEWPPLFPAVLSVHKIFGLPPVTFAAILHGFIFAGNILLSWAILRKVINTPFIFFLATLTILFSTPLLLVHVFVWSEAIFILLLLTSLLLLNKYLNRSRDPWLLLFLILLSCLMGLQRKAGLMFFLANFSIILFYGRSYPLLKRTLHACSYLILSFLPLFFYGLREFQIKKEILPDAGYNHERLTKNFINIAEVFTSWFFPDELDLPIRILLFSATVATIIVIIRLSSRIRRPKFQSLEVILFATSFLYFVILSFSLAYVYYVQEGIDERILSPVYVPVMICAFIMADITYNKVSLLPFTGDFIFRRIFIILLLIWMIYPVIRTGYHIGNWNKTGTGGYNGTYWKENNLLLAIARINPETPVYTNNIYAAVYFINLKKQMGIKFCRMEQIGQEDEYIALCFAPGFQHSSQDPSCTLPILDDKILLRESRYGEIWKVSKRENGRQNKD